MEIELSTRMIEQNIIPGKWVEQYYGGRGLAIKYLFENLPPGIDPLSSENILVIAPGLLVGTDWPASTQYHVSAKSPLTEGYGSAFAWGEFGREMKMAGISLLALKGVSPKPIYLVIENDVVKFEEAQDLWGLTTGKTHDILEERYPSSKIMAIGPAGENKVLLASIVADRYQNLIRTGMGAVMGSKNVKAIVIKGQAELKTSDSFSEYSKIMYEQIESHPASIRLREKGKAILVQSNNQIGNLATRNHQENKFSQANHLDAEALSRFVKHNIYCPTCPIGCLRFSEIDRGPFACKTEGPEYEPLWALGPRIGNSNLELLIYANWLCIDFGLDQIGTAGVIGFAMECKQRDLIKEEKYSYLWGDRHTILGIIEEIAHRTGIGEKLGQGTRNAAFEINPEALKYAMQCKGVELSAQEPRIAKSFGLQLAVSNWGADWGYGLPTIDVAYNEKAAKKFLAHLLPEVLDVSTEINKPELVVFSENYNAISDSLGLCKFSAPETYAVGPDDAAEGLRILGKEETSESLLEAGERIINLERLFNIREGFSRKDDYLPERFLKEPLEIEVYTGDRLTGLIPTGEKRIEVIHLDEMLDRYYDLRGWDREGRPLQSTLNDLGVTE